MKKGVTLIELLLVISIVAVIAGAISPFLSKFVVVNNFDSAQSKIKFAICRAQALSMDGKQNTNWGVCKTGNIIRVYSGSCNSPTIKEDFSISPSITVSSFDVVFDKRGEPNSVVTIDINSQLESKQIEINQAGGFDILAMATPTPTPTATPTATPTPTPSFYISSLTLVNAATDLDIATLTNGYIVDLGTYPSISIRANPVGSVESVVFSLDGNPIQTENLLPYAIAGDNSGDYTAWSISNGTHTVLAVPYDQDGGSGTSGGSVSLSVNFVTPTPTPTPTPGLLIADIEITDNWGSGFCAAMSITNNTASTVSGWTLVISREGYTTYSTWNGNYSAGASSYSITPAAWNTDITAGGTINDIGFCANKSGGYVVPEILSVN